MKHKNIISVFIFAIVVGAISLGCFFKPHTQYSESERRLLEKKPVFTKETLFSGSYTRDFEKYVTDQFPLRDGFRSVKALFSTYVFNKMENNGLFTAEGHISKTEYPVNSHMVDNAQQKFDNLYEKYMKDKNVNIYLSIIPDKNYFLAKKHGYLSIDYDSFINDFKGRMDYMKYIDVLPMLSIDDYYKTDSHWRQEKITDIAEHIAESMGADASAQYSEKTLDNPFCGVYLGQSALPFKPDTIKYLTNDILKNCIVKYYDTGMAKEGDMYNMDKAYGKDPYEMFLSGTSPLITIENPNAKTDKELILFRDSYGSSLSPLLAPAYSKITVVDIRYIQSDFLGNFIDFDNKDILFMYSTTLLNNSMAMR